MRPPRSAATSDARNCFSWLSGLAAETPRTFQFSGRSAAIDMSVRNAMSSSVKPDRQPGMIASSCVPGWARTRPASASSSRRDALRDGTGWPEPSLWVFDCDVDSPSAPSASARPSSATILSICSSVASPPTASSPIAASLSAECPTRKPALTAMRPSSRASQSPNDSHFQSSPALSASSGMPSTRASIRVR